MASGEVDPNASNEPELHLLLDDWTELQQTRGTRAHWIAF